MNDLKVLLRLQWQLTKGSLKYTKNKNSRLSGGLGLLVFAGVFLFSQSANASTACDYFTALGRPDLMLYSGFSFALLLEVMMGVLRGASGVTTNDADLLLSLPVRRSMVILAKSISKYLLELFFIACVFAPYVAVYVMRADFSVLTVCRGLLTLLLLPLLSVGLSYIAAWGYFKIGRFLPNPQTLTSVLTLLLVGAFLYVNFNFTGRYPAELSEAADYVSGLAPARWGMEFLAFASGPALLGLLAITAGPFVLGVRLHAAIFGSRQRTFRSGKKELDMRARSPFRSLLRKELHRYLGSPVWLTNTIISPLILLALVIAVALGLGRDFIAYFQEDPLLGALFPLFIAAFISGMSSMAALTACSISLEGRQLWILRMLPLSCRDVFGAKIAFQLLVCGTPALVASVACCFIFALPVAQFWFVILLPVLTVAFAACIGLQLNLLFPKLEWDNEAAVVKQSLSAMLGMFIGPFSLLPPLAGLIFAYGTFDIETMALLWAAWELLLLAGALALLRGAGCRRYLAL